ncbi:MAG: hypothetical protein N2559_05635, partial [Anaerolineae bacterium]|nr:hypothetical protein [Anaerolineae bacterium]
LSAASARAASPNRAGLVIVHGNGQTIKRCIEFSEAQISGLDLLTRSGLDLNVDANNAIGVAVCRIDHEGCTYPSEPCFCKGQGSPCIYWSYWRLASGAWKYSNVGASGAVVRNGDVDGWVWGVGTVSGATPPPLVTFDQVCAPVTATPTRTATATATATRPPPTNTSVLPTPTPTPIRFTATLAPPTPTPLIVAPSATLRASATLAPSATFTRASVVRATPTWTRSVVSPPTLTETATPLPTLIARAATRVIVTEEPRQVTREESSGAQGDAWGSVARLAGIALTGGLLCGALLIVFGVTFVVLRRVM